MSLISNLLGVLDRGRARLDDVGLRPFSVSVRTITWSGTRPGEGSPSVDETPITVANGRRPKVVEVHDKDVVAGGVMSKTRFEIQGITPTYTGGGTSPETLDPAVGSHPTELYYVLVGPGLPPSGALCRKIGGKFDRVFGYTITVETTGRAA